MAFVAPAILNPAGDTAAADAWSPTTSPQDEATENLVDTLRDTSIPAATVGHRSHRRRRRRWWQPNLDTTRGVADRLPLFFGGVLLVSFVLLMMVFRSVVVPLKAVIMNLLASAAAFGVLALAVSGGPLGDLVGIPEATPVPIPLPIGIFAILFGLSMDYEVFLLSRIKEEYDRTGDNALAVADGLAKSARVITAGAAVMVTVFLSFVLGDMVLGKMFGIGLAAADLHRRHPRPDGAGAGDDGAARRPQLVAAALARPAAPEHPRRGARGRCRRRRRARRPRQQSARAGVAGSSASQVLVVRWVRSRPSRISSSPKSNSSA